MSDRGRELHNHADVDRDVAQALTNRMHVLLRPLRGVVQDSEEQLEILNEIRSRFLPSCFMVVWDQPAKRMVRGRSFPGYVFLSGKNGRRVSLSQGSQIFQNWQPWTVRMYPLWGNRSSRVTLRHVGDQVFSSDDSGEPARDLPGGNRLKTTSR